MSNDPNKPYQDLPPLPPAVDIETPEVFRQTIAASRALARLEGATKRLPDPTMLINVIPLMEAQASSEIENIVTTNDELFKAAQGLLVDESPQVREALRYREALLAGFNALETRPLSIQTAIEVCSRILYHEAVIRNQPGTFIGSAVSKKRIYTPPEGRDVILGHLTEWENFLHDDHQIDPLVVMAMMHYQFEAIHPFFDGNGRTGRVLNLLFLVSSGLLDLPVLYLSGHIVRHKDQYYELLDRVTREGAWEEWIIFILRGVRSTAQWTLELIDEIDRLRSTMEVEIRDFMPRAPVEGLVRLMFRQPYLRIADVVEENLAQRQTVSRWLNGLAETGILQKEQIGKNVVFINIRLVDHLFNTPLPD